MSAPAVPRERDGRHDRDEHRRDDDTRDGRGESHKARRDDVSRRERSRGGDDGRDREDRTSRRGDRSRSPRARRSRSRDTDASRERRHSSHRHHRDKRRYEDDSDSGEERRRDRERRHRRHRHTSHRDRDRSQSVDAPRTHQRGDAVAVAPASALPPRAGGATAGERARAQQETVSRMAAMFGYTAENNPFGDTALTSSFVWRKKIEKDVVSGKRDRPPSKEETLAEREEMMKEIERAKARRQQREAEAEEMERLRAEEARLNDASQYANWEAKDEHFNLQQTKARCLVRIRDGREKPIDTLAKNQLLNDAVDVPDSAPVDVSGVLLDCELNSPRVIVGMLPLQQLEALHADVTAFVELEGGSGPHAPYWSALLLTVEDGMERTRAMMPAEDGAAHATGASMMMTQEIDEMLAGMGSDELTGMESTVRDTIRQGVAQRRAGADGAAFTHSSDPVVDVDYWERVLRHIKVAQARLTLERTSRQYLLKRLQQVQAAGLASGVMGRPGDAATTSAAAAAAGMDDGTADATDEVAVLIRVLRAAGVLPSPTATSARLEAIVHTATGGGVQRASKDTEEAHEEAILDNMGRLLPTGLGEAAMSNDVEILLPVNAATASAAAYAYTGETSAELDETAIAEKFRPRKPRFFNRVKTGYDWNKYNQTHYDHDNPPPKTVQGYKFNVFYPDLLDKSATPSYKLEPADTDDYCIIRFHAGPPYEDVAFKIVNREWETQPKHGFRCVFDRGVLQLHFNFKRMRYRK